MDKEEAVLTRAKILLAANDGASDEELWELSEVYGENRKDNLMSAIIASKLDHKIRFFADFLSEKMPNEAQSLLIKAVQMAGNWENRSQYEELIERYEAAYGQDYDLLVEKLNYYLKYDTKNTDKISELMAKIDEINEGEN